MCEQIISNHGILWTIRRTTSFLWKRNTLAIFFDKVRIVAIVSKTKGWERHHQKRGEHKKEGKDATF